MQNFSSAVGHLTRLTRKDEKFVWSEECEQAFSELKVRLTTAPVLTVPEAGIPYEVYKDASLKGLGCVLM